MVKEISVRAVHDDDTDADKGQSQNVYEIRKNIFKTRKNKFKSYCFLEIIFEEFIKSEKLLTNLNGIIESRNIILQIPNKFANPRIVAKSRKYFAHPKTYFVTCYLPQHSQRQFVSAILLYPKWQRSGCG